MADLSKMLLDIRSCNAFELELIHKAAAARNQQLAVDLMSYPPGTRVYWMHDNGKIRGTVTSCSSKSVRLEDDYGNKYEFGHVEFQRLMPEDEVKLQVRNTNRQPSRLPSLGASNDKETKIEIEEKG